MSGDIGYELKRQSTRTPNGVRIYRIVCGHPSCGGVVGPVHYASAVADDRLIAHATDVHGTNLAAVLNEMAAQS